MPEDGRGAAADQAAQILSELCAVADEAERITIRRRLPEGLEALGVRMREVFDLAARWEKRLDSLRGLVPELLRCPDYERRMVGVSILDFRARRRLDQGQREELASLYLDHHDQLSVWDLVDRAAPRVVGRYLMEGLGPEARRKLLEELADSADPMRRRTAVTATFWMVRQGELDDALHLAARLAGETSERVSQPVGTALREVGKIDQDRLVAFLREHGGRLQRVTVRYAVARLPRAVREEFVPPRRK
ncbi:DNA alkylation repair protein [Nesterenkonia sp. HG001]|uniref:DNA alkylation repair protein n=1 Tax=Nesterenkonia sp. HG001 TaxID=2983207 RepID=UPI002AC4028C|nr:DNA alkylation repair protein [Nesterenkonia sp. HG001]MDZ5077141.1 DNA alkylation repair protein [Nesterenkonia sp. HG001]